ncbi:MAG TPA: hypothetical protein VK524_10620, partial [Polyangiaceae bacterium]|nr:hypothetical protein [Polyangiaceae bacterium]
MGLRMKITTMSFAVALAACGSEGASPSDANSNPNVSAPSVRAPSAGCVQGVSVPCTCTDGRAGVSNCQLDNTFSACSCQGVPNAPVGPGMTGGTPNAGNAAPAPMAGAGMPPPNVEPPPGPGTGIVTVPPEDVQACDGMGTPPNANEQVEVLEIRTDKVVYAGKETAIVPGGFKAAAGTTYACFWVEIDMPEKHHIIGWEGAVGMDRTVHHQQVSLGAKPFYLAQQGGLCGLPTVDFTWTGARATEWTPGMVGYPLGGPENGGKARFLWQTHFEGATTYTGGFNAYITKNLRKYDGGNFEQGDVRGILIPAGGSATHVATCSPEDTKKKLVHPIYVYASMQHAHLTVKHLKSEQFRDGKSVFVFGDQAVGGFAGFFDQSFKPHTPCVEIRPGDQLVTTCDYTNPFGFDVTGGEATNQ